LPIKFFDDYFLVLFSGGLDAGHHRPDPGVEHFRPAGIDIEGVPTAGGAVVLGVGVEEVAEV